VKRISLGTHWWSECLCWDDSM